MQEIAFAENPKAFIWIGSTNQLGLLDKIGDDLNRRSPDRSSDNGYRAATDFLKKRFTETKMPTRLEQPFSYFILERICSDIETALKSEYPNLQRPRFGSLPTGTLNASALAAPGSDCSIVVVNTGLFPFCHELVKIGLETIRFEFEGENIIIDHGEESFNRLFRRNEAILLRFSKALEDFSNDRVIRGQAAPDQWHDPAVVQMVRSLEIFVVGHEYGHLALGHKSDVRTPLRNRAADTHVTLEPDAELVVRSWEQEIAADLFGAWVLERCVLSQEEMPGPDFRDFNLYAPLLFFELAEIAEEAKYIFDNKKMPPIPSAEERKDILNILTQCLNKLVDGETNVVPSLYSATSNQRFDTHPPDWSRRLLMSAHLESGEHKSSDEGRELRFIAVALGRNLRVLWNDMRPLWLQVVLSRGSGSDTLAEHGD